jgi:hypothetical protein
MGRTSDAASARRGELDEGTCKPAAVDVHQAAHFPRWEGKRERVARWRRLGTSAIAPILYAIGAAGGNASPDRPSGDGSAGSAGSSASVAGSGAGTVEEDTAATSQKDPMQFVCPGLGVGFRWMLALALDESSAHRRGGLQWDCAQIPLVQSPRSRCWFLLS